MNIRQYIRGLIAAALFAGMVPMAQAATSSAGFNVTVTLVKACTVSGGGPLDFGNYTSFQAAPVIPPAVNFTFTCTRGTGTAATAAFDVVNGTSSGTQTDPVGSGVVQGLTYTMLATKGTVVTGTAATAGALGVPGSPGTADTVAYQITGNMPGSQAGNTAENVSPQARLLILTF